MKKIAQFIFVPILILGLSCLASCEKNTGSGLPVDGDGNEYDTVVIDTQTWLTENLKTTKYINGDLIPLVTDNTTWTNFTRGAYCWYENNINYKDTFGAIYNGYVAQLSNFICPKGYHVPTIDDWSILINTLKDSPEETKQSFKAKQAGWRAAGGGSFLICCSCWWASSSYPDYDNITYKVTLAFELSDMHNNGGYSVRCIKNK